MIGFTSERDTPSSFNLSYDDEHVPQRELTDFVVTAGDDKISICALDDRRPGSSDVVARGSVVANGKSLKIESAPLIEWCIEYGQKPHLWVRSAKVWYRLTKPAKEYAKTHELARRRFELCSRIFILATTMAPNECTYKLFQQLLSGPYGKMKGYSEKELLSEKDFILAQIKNLDDPFVSDMAFVKELREKKVAGSKKSSATSKKSTAASASAGSPSFLGAWVPSGNLDKDGNTRLLKRAEKVVNQLYKHKNAYPFREPVNPLKDGCPDYLERISHPMDFGTMKKKFGKGVYASALEVAKDVRLMAKNCRDYNGDHHEFAMWATEMEHKFENLIRGGEDAEVAAMNKRMTSKKRKASDLSPSDKGTGKKSTPKIARKGSKASSLDVSPSRESSTKDDDSSGQRQCARINPEACENFQVAGSKYCSDECGLMVARIRVEEMSRAGYSVDEYIKSSLTKALVHSRS